LRVVEVLVSESSTNVAGKIYGAVPLDGDCLNEEVEERSGKFEISPPNGSPD
jgi:hypothetical protein